MWENEGINTLGGQPTLATQALAEKCRNVLLANGLAAVADNQEKKVTPAFEAVVEANILLSGLGFESGGLSIAHALHNALTSLYGKELKASHGQIIAVTTLIHLKVENHPELSEYQAFFKELSLPTTITELGVQLDKPSIVKVVELSFDGNAGIVRSGVKVTKKEVIAGIQAFI